MVRTHLAAILHVCLDTPTLGMIFRPESSDMPVSEWPFVAERLNRTRRVIIKVRPLILNHNVQGFNKPTMLIG